MYLCKGGLQISWPTVKMLMTCSEIERMDDEGLKSGGDYFLRIKQGVPNLSIQHEQQILQGSSLVCNTVPVSFMEIVYLNKTIDF